jgi:hypothetical protein
MQGLLAASVLPKVQWLHLCLHSCHLYGRAYIQIRWAKVRWLCRDRSYACPCLATFITTRVFHRINRADKQQTHTNPTPRAATWPRAHCFLTRAVHASVSKVLHVRTHKQFEFVPPKKRNAQFHSRGIYTVYVIPWHVRQRTSKPIPPIHHTRRTYG